MDRRRFLLTSLAGVVAAPLAAEAQAGKVFKVGVLYPGTLDPRRLDAIRQGLMEGLSNPGRRIEIARSADGRVERLDALAADLVRLRVDVLFAIAPAAIRAARPRNANIPIVVLDLETDPVAAGWITSIARPGGNLTGIFFDTPEVAGKWIELLREVVPALSRIALLWDPTTGPAQASAAENAARLFGLRIERISAREPKELDPAVDQAARGRGALVALSSPIFSTHVNQIAERALRHRLPAIMLFPEFARVGGLLAYGPDNFDLLRQSGTLVAKVLQGAAPATFPIERPARLVLVVNLKTAKALGLTIPPSLLARADQVIE